MDTASKSLCDMTSAELESAADLATNRYMATCYRQLAAAKTQLALNNKALAAAHYARSKAAYETAQAEESSQVAAAMAKQRANVKSGIARNVVTKELHYGSREHISMRETHLSTGEARSLATSASVAK